MSAPRTSHAVCILAGGASSRFGSDKALASFDGQPLLKRVILRISTQTNGPIAINATRTKELSAFGFPVVEDRHWAGQGPLAGILSAMDWAAGEGASEVITLAVDLPFVPLNFVEKLSSHGAPSIAASLGQSHPVNGLWMCSQRDALDAYLSTGRRSAHGWAESCNASVVEFNASSTGRDPFCNINTREDLTKAEGGN